MKVCWSERRWVQLLSRWDGSPYSPREGHPGYRGPRSGGSAAPALPGRCTLCHMQHTSSSWTSPDLKVQYNYRSYGLRAQTGQGLNNNFEEH
jgi:hypothetical protein